jgi:hypothetical protein
MNKALAGTGRRDLLRSSLRSAARLWTAALLAMTTVGTAQAGGGYYGRHWHGGHWGDSSVGVVVGVPLGWPYYAGGFYDWPYYPPARTVVVEQEPTVYIERGASASDGGDGGDGWWHYCHNPKGYYPSVKKCPGGWERVAPNPTD